MTNLGANFERAKLKKQFIKQYPYGDVSKFEFEVHVNNGDIALTSFLFLRT